MEDQIRCQDRLGYALGLAGGLIALLLSPNLAFSHPINMDAICKIESNCNPRAISYRGAEFGRGLYQISELALFDFKKSPEVKAVIMKDDSYLDTSELEPIDLFIPEINEHIASWYLNDEIPRLLNHFKNLVNTKNILIAYNCGIECVTKGKIPKETRNYLKKYEDLTGEKL